MDKFSTCSDDENNAAAVFSFYQLSSLSPDWQINKCVIKNAVSTIIIYHTVLCRIVAPVNTTTM
jgi:hypothetical protein